MCVFVCAYVSYRCNVCKSFVNRLRLKKLKDEMRHDELANQSDDTFNEVLRDFSRVQIMSESTSKSSNLT